MKPQSAALATFVLFGAGVASPAAANEVGFYIGAHYGQVTKDADRAEFEDFALDVYDFFRYTPAEINASYDDKDKAYSILVGYRLTPYLAVEGAYMDLGQVAYRSTSRGSFPNDQGAIDVSIASEITGFAVAVLGILPINRNWELYGRLAALTATNSLVVNLTARGDIFAPPGGGNLRDEFSESSTEWLAGAGASMRFLEMYDLRLEYQRIVDAGKEQTGGVGDVDVISLGVTATF